MLDKHAPKQYHIDMNDYELIAPYYDLEHADYQDDVDLYLNYAAACGSPVLELGCGTGRLLMPLARRGVKLIGVDSSPAMLARARQHLEAQDLLKHVELIEADARVLQISQRFRLAFVALNSFAHFITRDDQRAVLGTLHEHLLPGGTLILDLPYADIRRHQQADGQMFHQGTWLDQSRSELVSHLVAPTTDATGRILYLTHFYDAHSQGGPLSRTIVQTTLALLSPGEAALLVESSGFHVQRLFGDYDLNPCEAESPRLIVIASRAK